MTNAGAVNTHVKTRSRTVKKNEVGPGSGSLVKSVLDPEQFLL